MAAIYRLITEKLYISSQNLPALHACEAEWSAREQDHLGIA